MALSDLRRMLKKAAARVSHYARIRAILCLLAGLGAAGQDAVGQSAAKGPSDLTGLLTQIDGPVTLSSGGREEFRSVRRAAQRQAVRRGEVVHVPADARAVVICSTEALVNLAGPRDWVLDAPGCGRGAPLPVGSYRSLASFAGRLLPRDGALLLELETREVEVGPGPVLLSPRNTAVMEARPRLVWTRVEDAVEYGIAVRGAAVGASIQLAADEVRCGPGSGPWQDLDVCSWVPTGKWPALEPGRPVWLRLRSRQARTAPWREARQVYRVQLLPPGERQAVEERLRQLSALPLQRASGLLLAAGAYARAGLVGDAVAAYDEELRVLEVPEARVTLGDIYSTLGLTALAEGQYRKVLADAADPAARAAAELGLGQAAYRRTRYGESGSHFERARELYAALGLVAEAEQAQTAAGRARAAAEIPRP
jgi:hypothetical protein